jgi:subtilisin family serine protease
MKRRRPAPEGAEKGEQGMVRIVRRCLIVVVVLLASAGSAGAAGEEHILLHSTGSREQMRAAVAAVGGKVTREFQNVNAVAATVPVDAMAGLAAVPEFKLVKDQQMSVPEPRDRSSGIEARPDALATPEAASGGGGAVPNDYRFNNTLIRADVVQAGGVTGKGVVVAVIDTGTSNSPVVTALYGRVIGGQSFVTSDAYSATSTRNHNHGTAVGSMIAGNATPGFLADSCLATAVRRHAPAGSWFNETAPLPDGTSALMTFIPLRGVAPDAKLYALKVLDANGSGYQSWIVGAMDRAITMKRNFLAGQPSVPVAGDGSEANPFRYDSLDISVVNMSLGGPALDPGLGLEDQLVRQFLDVGIVPTIAAANAGPSGMTTGSPSTGPGALSTAAASTPTHLRIVESYAACDPDVGAIMWPDDRIRTALFSSRGPTADGRTGISVTTAGDLNFLQNRKGSFSFGSGTSFAAPTVAGAAALLRAGAPRATAMQIRNSIEEGANPRVLGDHSTAFDQGFGFLDVARSLQLLKAGHVSGTLRTSHGGEDVAHNLKELGLDVRELEGGKSFSARTGALLPGERREYLVEVDKDVASLRIDVTGVSIAPPAKQNQFWGDDVILAVHSAKTTSLNDYRVNEYIRAPASYSVGDLDTGVMRLTFLGSDSNAGKAGLEFTVTAIPSKLRAAVSTRGTIGDGGWEVFPVDIPAGAGKATFELSWKRDWSVTPTNDIDLYVIDPDGNEVLAYYAPGDFWYSAGASLRAPERVVAEAPKPGAYTIYVNGYTVFADPRGGPGASKTDEYRLKVYLE